MHIHHQMGRRPYGGSVGLPGGRCAFGLATPMSITVATGDAAAIRNIKQNLFLPFVYNAIEVPIAAGVLYPAF